MAGPVPDSLIAKLLEELASTRELGDACSLVVERVGAETGFDRAVFLLEMDSVLRGSARHLSYEQMAAVLAAAGHPDTALSGVLSRLDAPSVVPADALPPLGLDSQVAIPCRDVDGEPFGLLVVPGDMVNDACLRAAEILARIGPALALRSRAQSLKERTERLSVQRDLLTHLINTLSDPILVTDERNDIILANRRAEQLFLSAPGDNEGRRRAIQINNLLFSSFLTRGVIGGPHDIGRELNLVDTEEGSDLLFEVISVPLEGAIDRGGIMSVLRDITDLKRAVGELETQIKRSRIAEHEARQERDRLNSILENVSDPILVTDEHSNIILMNPEADRLFIPPADGTGDATYRHLIRANDTKFTTLISNFLLRDEQRMVQRITTIDPDTADNFPAEVASSKILNARGEPVAIVSVIHDLTQAEENERLARELQQLNDQLEERIRHATQELEEHNRRLEWQSIELEKASRLKTEFLASMSHELRTPINVMLGYTSLLRDRIYGELNGPQDEALGRIYVTSQHLLELINNILDLSKIEAGMMPVTVTEVHIPHLVHELAETVAPILAKKQLEFEKSVDGAMDVVQTDRVKLKQVLLNLLSNAIKFTPQGHIRLEARAPAGGGVEIEVSDTGVGIRPEHLHAIFEAFRQVDQSHTREFAGTGLGLSITKKLLDLLGGEIAVESEYGSGTRFTVKLPDRSPDLTPAEAVSAGGSAAVAGNGSPG